MAAAGAWTVARWLRYCWRFAQVRLDRPVRPHPVIWTDERAGAWRRDGIRPPVAVWTLRQLVTFLTAWQRSSSRSFRRGPR